MNIKFPSPKIQNLVGKRYGRLVVTEFAYTKTRIGSFWVCKCDCGKEKIVRRGPLVSFRTLSCGCLAQENKIKNMQAIFRGKNNEQR